MKISEDSVFVGISCQDESPTNDRKKMKCVEEVYGEIGKLEACPDSSPR